MSYRIRNWSEYNKGLKQRGSLTFWISPEALANWEVTKKTGKPGATPTYTNQAIVTMVSLKSVFGLPGRALCGFVESIFERMQVKLSVPDTCDDIETFEALEGLVAGSANKWEAACGR